MARRWAGRDIYSPRPCVAAPDLRPLAWSVSSLRRSLHGRACLRPTAGSAAPPVRASSDRPLAGPRAQDREKKKERERDSPTTTELDLTMTFTTHDQPTTHACCPPFVERGSALRSAGLRPSLGPVRGSTSLRGVSRRLSKGGVPPLRPPHAMPPPMGSELPCPLPVPVLAPQRGAQTRALAQVSLLRLWLVGLRFKITTGKEKRLSQRVAAR